MIYPPRNSVRKSRISVSPDSPAGRRSSIKNVSSYDEEEALFPAENLLEERSSSSDRLRETLSARVPSYISGVLTSPNKNSRKNRYEKMQFLELENRFLRRKQINQPLPENVSDALQIEINKISTHSENLSQSIRKIIADCAQTTSDAIDSPHLLRELVPDLLCKVIQATTEVLCDGKSEFSYPEIMVAVNRLDDIRNKIQNDPSLVDANLASLTQLITSDHAQMLKRQKEAAFPEPLPPIEEVDAMSAPMFADVLLGRYGAGDELGATQVRPVTDQFDVVDVAGGVTDMVRKSVVLAKLDNDSLYKSTTDPKLLIETGGQALLTADVFATSAGRKSVTGAFLLDSPPDFEDYSPTKSPSKGPESVNERKSYAAAYRKSIATSAVGSMTSPGAETAGVLVVDNENLMIFAPTPSPIDAGPEKQNGRTRKSIRFGEEDEVAHFDLENNTKQLSGFSTRKSKSNMDVSVVNGLADYDDDDTINFSIADMANKSVSEKPKLSIVRQSVSSVGAPFVLKSRASIAQTALEEENNFNTPFSRTANGVYGEMMAGSVSAATVGGNVRKSEYGRKSIIPGDLENLQMIEMARKSMLGGASSSISPVKTPMLPNDHFELPFEGNIAPFASRLPSTIYNGTAITHGMGNPAAVSQSLMASTFLGHLNPQELASRSFMPVHKDQGLLANKNFNFDEGESDSGSEIWDIHNPVYSSVLASNVLDPDVSSMSRNTNATRNSVQAQHIRMSRVNGLLPEFLGSQNQMGAAALAAFAKASAEQQQKREENAKQRKVTVQQSKMLMSEEVKDRKSVINVQMADGRVVPIEIINETPPEKLTLDDEDEMMNLTSPSRSKSHKSFAPTYLNEKNQRISQWVNSDLPAEFFIDPENLIENRNKMNMLKQKMEAEQNIDLQAEDEEREVKFLVERAYIQGQSDAMIGVSRASFVNMSAPMTEYRPSSAPPPGARRASLSPAALEKASKSPRKSRRSEADQRMSAVGRSGSLMAPQIARFNYGARESTKSNNLRNRSPSIASTRAPFRKPLVDPQLNRANFNYDPTFVEDTNSIRRSINSSPQGTGNAMQNMLVGNAGNEEVQSFDDIAEQLSIFQNQQQVMLQPHLQYLAQLKQKYQEFMMYYQTYGSRLPGPEKAKLQQQITQLQQMGVQRSQQIMMYQRQQQQQLLAYGEQLKQNYLQKTAAGLSRDVILRNKATRGVGVDPLLQHQQMLMMKQQTAGMNNPMMMMANNFQPQQYSLNGSPQNYINNFNNMGANQNSDQDILQVSSLKMKRLSTATVLPEVEDDSDTFQAGLNTMRYSSRLKNSQNPYDKGDSFEVKGGPTMKRLSSATELPEVNRDDDASEYSRIDFKYPLNTVRQTQDVLTKNKNVNYTSPLPADFKLQQPPQNASPNTAKTNVKQNGVTFA
eukprot:GDKJ01016349.1.p1 GENE.GDKJ01016349.1~~GDKJ01016349.1.p1  ORF type:complete len:1407 (-),score=351.01 GDKJ01016349.1:55-4275(-)